MDARHFDTLTRALTEGGTRRGLLSLLAALGSAIGLAGLITPESAAKRKRPGRRRSHRPGKGKESRKGKRKRKDKNTQCQAHSDCGAGALCLSDGACQACSVACSGTPEECGAALQTALEAGGTVYVCPGTYQGGFIIEGAVTVIGAGERDDPASNTILDGNDAARVVTIEPGTGTVELTQLRLTGGDAGVNDIGSALPGGGVHHQGTTLRMRDCTITGNTAGGGGGGISSDTGATLELTRCTLSENHSGGGGGGILSSGTTTLTDCLIEGNDGPFGAGIASDGTTTLAGSTAVRGNAANIAGGGILARDGTLTIAETCRVTENRASGGGGIFWSGGTVTLEGDDPSPIVADNCPENCAGTPVPKCAPGGGTCPP